LNFFFILVLISNLSFSADSFETESAELAQKLKTNLMAELKEKITSSGTLEAISFCHLNVKPLAKSSAGENIKKYSFGRTSHKIRNRENSPDRWIEKYIDTFKSVKSGDKFEKPLIHTFADGKKAYLEPLFVQPMCLSCHGSSISKEVKAEIKKRYPDDQAIGFKVGDFRGFIWVKQK
jgi:hypothetical protein